MIAIIITLAILIYIAIKEAPNIRDKKDLAEWGCSLLGLLMIGTIILPLVSLVLLPCALLAKWAFGVDIDSGLFFWWGD